MISKPLLQILRVALLGCLVSVPWAACGFTHSDSQAESPITGESKPQETRHKFPMSTAPHYTKVFDIHNWLISDQKSVWTTVDGGASWTKTLTPSDLDEKPVNVHGISFIPEGSILLATDTFLLKSSDFGRTWVERNPLDFSANAIFFSDENIGWAVATIDTSVDLTNSKNYSYWGAIFRTEDGGKSWSKCEIVDSERISKELGSWTIADIYMNKSGSGLAVGSGVILSTRDYGKTWKLTSAERFNYFRVRGNEQIAWAISTGNDVISTTKDNGSNWRQTKVPFDNSDTVLFVTFIDGTNAFLGMNRLFVTRNGGVNWVPQRDGLYTYHLEVLGENKLVRLIIKDEVSFALLSVDGGLTWRPVPMNVPIRAL